MRCPNCGTEFKGNFCPACGTKATAASVCPVCGQIRAQNAKFCSACGYDFSRPDSVGKSSLPSDPTVRAYALLFHLPAALFALFSLLLFAFFAAPVASFATFSLGNVYSLMPETSLTGSMAALITFAALSVPTAAAILLLHIPALRMRIARPAALSCIFAGTEYLFYFLFLLMGCIVCGQIGAEDDGLGVLAAGACPVLLIVFSTLFALLTAAAQGTRQILRKCCPALQERQALLLQNVRKERAARAKAAAPSKKTTALKTVRKYVHFKRLIAGITLTPFVWAAVMLLFGFSTLSTSGGEIFGLNMRTFLLYVLPVCIAALFFVFFLIFSMRRIKAFPVKKIRARGGMIAAGVVNLLCSAALLLLAVLLPFWGDRLTFFILPCILGAAYFIALALVGLIGTKKRRKKILLLFYGTEKPQADARPVLTYEQLAADMQNPDKS